MEMRAAIPALKMLRAGRLGEVVNAASKRCHVQRRGVYGEECFCRGWALAIQESMVAVAQSALNCSLERAP